MVVAILGLLASIILVAARGARERARIARTLQFSATVRHALGAYLIGEWNFNDGTYNDTSGNKNNGEADCGEIVDYGIEKKASEKTSLSCLNFSVPSSSKLNSTSGSITMEMWIRPFQNNIAGILFERKKSYRFNYSGYDTNRYFHFYVYRDAGFNKECGLRVDNLRLKTNDWNHVLATYDRTGNIKIYLNADIIDSYSCDKGGGNLFNDIYDLDVASDRLLAVIDEVRLYDASLTLSQIQKLYAEGLSKRGLAVDD